MIRPADAVGFSFERFPVRIVMDLIGQLAELDRYQASHGIEKAADIVAGAAERAGLSGVRIHTFPADGMAAWWSFAAPRSWTPLRATLDLATDPPARLAEYPRQPLVLATHSAPTQPAGASYPLLDLREPGARERVRGTVVLIPRQPAAAADPPLRLLVEELERRGAAGFVTDVAAPQPSEAGASGRIELDRHTSIFGFSVAPQVMSLLRDGAGTGTPVRVSISVDRSARMPIVVGELTAATTATAAKPILLQAHLCHPRPGANDNGSGVAALLGIAAALAGAGDGASAARPVQFLWGPEFTGTAAYLHDFVAAGRHPRPAAVFNLDMVGEDQAQCGGPLVVERPPADLPTFLPALVTEFLHLLPSSATSYSGGTALPEWNWAEVPFCGASDHALYADRSIGCPAVAFGHWPDRFRHTSLDTVDRVSPAELRRVAAAVGGLTRYLRHAGPQAAVFIRAAVARWSADQMNRISRAAASRAPGERPGVFDPLSPGNVAAFLRHQADRAHADMGSIWALNGNGSVARAGLLDLLGQQARVFAQLDGAAGADRGGGAASLAADDVRYWRGWPGPFNLEGLIADATPADRDWLIEQDQRSAAAYPLMMALALAIGDGSPLSHVVRMAAYSTWLPVDIPFATRYLGILSSAGWTATGPRPNGVTSALERKEVGLI